MTAQAFSSVAITIGVLQINYYFYCLSQKFSFWFQFQSWAQNKVIPVLSNWMTSIPKNDFFLGTGSGILSSPRMALQTLRVNVSEMLKNWVPANMKSTITTVLINLNFTLRLRFKHHIVFNWISIHYLFDF